MRSQSHLPGRLDFGLKNGYHASDVTGAASRAQNLETVFVRTKLKQLNRYIS
jgi:hypothetical protein